MTSLTLLLGRFCNAVCPGNRVCLFLYPVEPFLGKCNIYHFLCQTRQVLGERLQVGVNKIIQGFHVLYICNALKNRIFLHEVVGLVHSRI